MNRFYFFLGMLMFIAMCVLPFYLFIRSGRRTGQSGAAPRVQLADVRRLADEARQAEHSLRQARTDLERQTEALRRLQFAVRDEANFKLYAQRHRESRLLADRWHTHKRGAVATQRRVAATLQQIRAQQRSRSGAAGAAARTLLDQLQPTVAALNEEVRLGAASLNEANQRTGALRDHIGKHCGPPGRDWYDQLQARKQQQTA